MQMKAFAVLAHCLIFPCAEAARVTARGGFGFDREGSPRNPGKQMRIFRGPADILGDTTKNRRNRPLNDQWMGKSGLMDEPTPIESTLEHYCGSVRSDGTFMLHDRTMRQTLRRQRRERSTRPVTMVAQGRIRSYRSDPAMTHREST